MRMRIVERPVMRPMHCAALPTIGQTAEGERWIDTGSELPGFDNHVYLSESAVRQASKLFGFAPSSEVDELREAIADLTVERDAAMAEIARLNDALLSARIVEQYIESLTEPEPDVADEEEKV